MIVGALPPPPHSGKIFSCFLVFLVFLLVFIELAADTTAADIKPGLNETGYR
ncbi:MAG TPA: hypothetical protein PLT37_11080 [Kiritimatiellia bacterium]|jgi:hypothetical protein|nr:hypothetical protein [Kiritimatiellia bacterium]HQF21767.1 hypothetical protein [Kiritimatiellia bacterium]HQG74032.1 hypothetical protein [Kiritimatiellia bacterium]HXK80022.1 hypothetical protein [Kiritimatiellia bacterium]